MEKEKNVQTLTVMIADDHQLFVESLKLLLGLPMEGYDLRVQAIALTGDELVTALQRYRPDLLLLDINLPGKNGLDVLREMKKHMKGTRVLALTMYDDPKIIKSAFDLGIDGYLLKNCGKDEFQEAIRTVLSGDIYMDKNVSASGISQGSSAINTQFEDVFQKKFSLTKREVEILRLIVQAQNNQTIAGVLFISEQTAAVHRKNIMRKIGVNSTAALIKVAYENNLIK
ncbi:MAG: hypothetical protein RL757_3094 [Bacteroidota bacterium]|jgi:DNA-binding NarL/FixJ family response regulator